MAHQSQIQLRSRSRTIDGTGSTGVTGHVAPPPGLFNAAGAPATMPTSQTLLLQLLEEQRTQNQLIANQLSMMHRAQACATTVYTNPDDILNHLDPSLKLELQEWSRDYRAVLHQCATQETLQQKYSDIIEHGELHKQFKDEVSKTWQWPGLFKSEARELTECLATLNDGENDTFADVRVDGTPFNLDDAYRALRKEHADECQAFVFAYQRQCLDFFRKRVNVTYQKVLLDDRFETWCRKFEAFLSADAKVSLQRQVLQFADLTFRTEQPKAMNRQEKERANRIKQKEELTKAEAEFRLMDVQKLLAMAVLEHSALSGRSSANKDQRVVPKHGALAFFLKQYPELASKYNITVGSQDKKPKPKEKFSKSHSRGRSARSSSKASRTSKSGKSRESRKTSRARSTSSHRSKASQKSGGRGKGRGRGRGKGKGKAEGKEGKKVRMQTPAPRSN